MNKITIHPSVRFVEGYPERYQDDARPIGVPIVPLSLLHNDTDEAEVPTTAEDPALHSSVVQNVASLLRVAIFAFGCDEAAAKTSVVRALSLLRDEFGNSGNHPRDIQKTIGLAKWQVLRVSAFINQHFHETISVKDLSRVAGRSVSHFTRSFRASFGVSPHAYLMGWRVNRARDLMLTSDLSLSEIALSCGFSDQAHLSRLFRQMVGESPRVWRHKSGSSTTSPVYNSETGRARASV